MVVNFNEQKSILTNFLAEIRDEEIQKDRMRFRQNLRRMAEIMAYEISKSLKYKKEIVRTPLGEAEVNILQSDIVLATILRAGLPMHDGLLNYFDKADSAFISAYRKHTTGDEFDIHVQYAAAPSIEDKTLIISDPMLATGKSMVCVYKELLKNGIPKETHIVSAVATQQAIDYLKNKIPSKLKIWVGAIDDELTVKSYIVPGIGDAGDLAFGDKL